MLSRRHLLLILAAAACGPVPTAPPPPPPRPDPLDQALAWLAAQQAADGHFRSPTYGFMKGGHSLTALLAGALQQVGATSPLLDGALSWLHTQLRAGPLGFSGPALDYPVYATALGLKALLVAGRTEGLDPALSWLRQQQFTDAWADTTAHGGFGMGRHPDQPAPVPPNPGHVDLSMTRRALQALAQADALGLLDAKASLALGATFAQRCRAGDGGFVYSPTELALNKSAATDPGTPPASPADHRGYGSATADGVLALAACGHTDGVGRNWLLGHLDVTANPGLEGAPIAAYAQAMRFYWRAALAEALGPALPPDTRVALVAAVLAEQHDDGRWQSDIALQKEDDPLVATGLALLALGHTGLPAPG